MAKNTAKKNIQKNEARMRLFTIITWAVNVLSIFSIIYHRGSFPALRDVVGILFWAGQEVVALFLLRQFAKPLYSSAGELLDCSDVSNPKELGTYSFVQDLLWICWVAQLLCSLFHWAFFVIYLPVPATAIYHTWRVVSPLLAHRNFLVGGSTEGSAAPRNRAERRKQELLERKKKNS